MMQRVFFLLMITVVGTLISCSETDSDEASQLSILSVSIDGAMASEEVNNVGLNPEITFTFDAAVSPESFENALDITGGGATVLYGVRYSNSNSRATITPSFEANNSYVLSVEANSLGAGGEILNENFTLDLSTSGTTVSACNSASNDCLRQMIFNHRGSNYAIDYYSSFNISGESNLDQITHAIILIHGANRNNDDYFTWMNTTLENLAISNSTLLIAPRFNLGSEISSQNELYWNNNDWREGVDSGNNFKISSFAVVDSLIKQVTEQANSLERIVVTGHSSGGLFTHVYGSANAIENEVNVPIDYVVANSQYFYYPTGERVNEDTNQLFTPSDCAAYDLWPFGYNLLPDYVRSIDQAVLNDQFVNRSIYYLLGNGNQSDPSLNTSNCAATLLGSSRYNRGENMYFYMEQKFANNNHNRVIVDGIGHDGQAMYQSTEFESFITDLFMP